MKGLLMNRYTIPLPEALKLAAQRRAERHATVQAELDDLKAGGCALNINAAQVIALQDAGLLYDFETGFIEDFTQAPDNPGRAILSEALNQRHQFYTEVATVYTDDSAKLLQELSREMTVAL
jgi:hypothetical protein